jgi:hypothetical protein
VIAKIRFVFLPHFFSRGFLAMFRIRHIVLDAHLAHVQLGVACLARIEATKRQTEC